LLLARRSTTCDSSSARRDLKRYAISQPRFVSNDLRFWTKVSNPNPFGLTLTTLDGTLRLEGTRAATASFPLGLPLEARRDAVIPLDVAVSFADIPGLADVARRAASQQPVGYALEGRIGVDAGRQGTPVFGPMPLVRGELRTR
jgi:LEA14-like dessication related protein